MRSSFPDRLRPRRGAALFVVTIVIVLVSLTAYSFVILMQAENRAAHMSADRMQVQAVGDSAGEYLKTLLAMPRIDRDLVGGWFDNPNQFQDVVVDRDYFGQRHGRFCVLASKYDEENPDEYFFFGVECTSAKISLPTLLQWDEIEPGSGRLALMRLPGMTETVADSILDWIDPDDQPREFGAELEFYSGLNPPRAPINQVPAHLEMLLAVRGVSRMRLLDGSQPTLGPDRKTNATDEGSGSLNSNGLPSNDLPIDTSNPNDRSASSSQRLSVTNDSTLDARPWSHFLTVYSAERNEAYDGFPRIHLNQENLVSLHEQLSSRFSEELANFVLLMRQSGPAEERTDARSADQLPTISLTESAGYEFLSPLDVVDAFVIVGEGESDESQDDEPVFKSPISTDGNSEISVIEFCDATTTREDPIIVGRVDLNRATAEVLAAIPEFPPEAVEQVVATRDDATSLTPERRHASWLLAEGIVELETMRLLLPFLTVGGDVIQGEVVAYYDADSPWSRHEFVLDGTPEEITTLFYRDLRRSGRGYRYDELALVDDPDQPLGGPPAKATDSRASALPQSSPSQQRP
ncbi:MAG: type II secretion system protein GspK [Pirellulaceae bacterium]|nr:type II secretion system protein GspK [Pirellulaceae bacterium]